MDKPPESFYAPFPPTGKVEMWPFYPRIFSIIKIQFLSFVGHCRFAGRWRIWHNIKMLRDLSPIMPSFHSAFCSSSESHTPGVIHQLVSDPSPFLSTWPLPRGHSGVSDMQILGDVSTEALRCFPQRTVHLPQLHGCLCRLTAWQSFHVPQSICI